MPIRIPLFFLLILIVGAHSTQCLAAGFMDRFVDPEDGMFDTSEWLLTHRGFLPVPMIITEPAVDNGLGLGLAFFHEAKKTKPSEGEHSTGALPPSISAVFGAATGNDSWFAGGGHWGSWKNDSIRYLGGAGLTSVNLKFYGGGDSPNLSKGLKYNLDGWFLIQRASFRISNTPYFLGGEVTYFDSSNTFDIPPNITGIESWEFDIKNLGLGFVLEYDGRDNIFTPTQGLKIDYKNKLYVGEGALSRSYEYFMSEFSSLKYWKLSKDLNLGWRVEGDFSSGEVPFYALPFIYMRGIPMMRYQGNHVALTELEGRWNFTPRWSMLGFTGVGRTANSLSSFGSSTNRSTIGTGFRYLTARQLGMHAGMDIAKGPEEWVFYITIGSAWAR
ncbi:MAG: glyceraldehyde-3-phosphate dehydrogenase [Gammaproteobacteria bacterium]|nr:glyceraldehyde-3-phosphate dehydrogenase [Gammaproteobacteria bacterium]